MTDDEGTVAVEWDGTVRHAVGEREVARPVDAGTTVHALLRAVATDHADSDSLLFTSEERLPPHLNVARDGRPIRDLDGPETTVEPGDRPAVAPAVSGGTDWQRAARAGANR